MSASLDQAYESYFDQIFDPEDVQKRVVTLDRMPFGTTVTDYDGVVWEKQALNMWLNQYKDECLFSINLVNKIEFPEFD